MLQAGKPDSVSGRTTRMAIIYLFHNLRRGIHLPTLPNSAATFYRAGKKLGFTWHFSIQGLPKAPITKHFCEPLPHIFTIALLVQGCYFLWHLLLFDVAACLS